jgi:hypothetical protein
MVAKYLIIAQQCHISLVGLSQDLPAFALDFA